MKRTIRIIFALFATLALMFINIGPLALSALAWKDSNTWTTPPSWNTEPTWKTPPKWEGPKWKSSGWDTQPTWKTQPNWQNPGWNTQPSWKTEPNWQSPGWNTQPSWKTQPDWQSPGWENQPNWQTPGWENQPSWENQPNWNDPNWNGPNWNNPNSNQLPDPNNNGTNTDPTSPDGLQPNVPGDPNPPISPYDKNNPLTDDQTNQQEDFDSANNNNNEKDDPFFQFDSPKAKDVADYVVGDVVGGTIDFIDDSLRNGDITITDFLKGKASMGYSGFKVFTSGDTSFDALHDGYELLKAPKEIYDKYKIINDLKNVEELRKAGRITDYVREFEQLYKTGKTFSTGNAIVSTITMPLTIWDTVDNVKKLNNATTAEEKSDAKWGLFENSGAILSGAAPLVAMIPGAQPIAAGMAIVGLGIGAVGLGRKLWKNRKEIADDVVKKAKKVGKWFKSLFKG